MEIAEEIKNIRKDLDTLVQLFSKLVNKIVPEEEEAEKEDVMAIKNDDEIVDEKEIFRVLE